MANREKILVTGTGAVAGAIVRALVPAGYEVHTTGLSEKGITAYSALSRDWTPSPDNVLSVLRDDSRFIDPFISLPTYTTPHISGDLSDFAIARKAITSQYDTIILTAANPNSDQSEESARRNMQIDRNSIDAALGAGIKNIIFTSSVWRNGHTLLEGKEPGRIRPEREAPADFPYSKAKASSVRYLKSKAEFNPDKTFSYIDLGGYIRETMGAPISNVDPMGLQWWLAECELQDLFLRLCGLPINPEYEKERKEKVNVFGFNGFSPNNPPAELNHPQLPYDLSSSTRLGVKHRFNVYEVLKNRHLNWRKIPVPSK